MAYCQRCRDALSSSQTGSPSAEDGPTLFEIDFARALVNGDVRGGSDEAAKYALAQLVSRFDVVASQLFNARSNNAELETSLKIARSNLVLAEANAEAMEETLRRRAPVLQPSAFPGASMSSGPPSAQPVNTPDSNLWGEPLMSSPLEHTSSMDEGSKGSLAAFFRRKRTGTPLVAAESASLPDTPTFSDLPPSPLPEGSDAIPGLAGERVLLNRRLEHLSALLSSERTATKQLRDSHADLIAERDKLNAAHNELQGELESLSAALFEEANKMVADERRKVSEYEDEILELRAQLAGYRGDTASSVSGREDGALGPPSKDSASETSSMLSGPSLALHNTGAMNAHLTDDFSNSSPAFSIGDSPAITASVASSPALYGLQRASSLQTTSPSVPSSSPEVSAGRQWLRSFSTRRKAPNRTVELESAFAALEAEAGPLESASTATTRRSRRSLALDDGDLLPASASTDTSPLPPSDELNLGALRDSTIKRAADDERSIVGRKRTASNETKFESWTKRSTASSFATPDIETAFMTSPPLPRMPLQQSSPRPERSSSRKSSSSQRKAGLKGAASPRSPRQVDLERSRTSAYRGSPPPSPARSPLRMPPTSPLLERSDPSRSEPLPYSATFAGGEGLPARKSSNRASQGPAAAQAQSLRRHRPAPLQLSSPKMDESEELPRAPTPKSARRAGFMLGLDAAQLFPHRGPRAEHLAHKLNGSSGSEEGVRVGLSASRGTGRPMGFAAPTGVGVGLMKQVARPTTPVSPMEDLDRLLEDLSTMESQLAFSRAR